ncbi:1-acyl-sn-glycerol-3-phosphate acyltransferase, partial [Escherichia coli]|nr:1-acyl-sn-glycerol-3-phosphate acyltransferase [Escherichia coli]
GEITVVICPPVPHASGSEAELMEKCERLIETQQPLISGAGPFAAKMPSETV